jgi:hypothetical protein
MQRAGQVRELTPTRGRTLEMNAECESNDGGIESNEEEVKR